MLIPSPGGWVGGNASKNRITRATKVKSEHHKVSGRGINQSSSLERWERATCQATGDPSLRTKFQRIAATLPSPTRVHRREKKPASIPKQQFPLLRWFLWYSIVAGGLKPRDSTPRAHWHKHAAVLGRHSPSWSIRPLGQTDHLH
jgi:hypothetical protein